MARKKKTLTKEDSALWASTTLSVDPLQEPARNRVPGQTSDGGRALKRAARSRSDSQQQPEKRHWQRIEQRPPVGAGGVRVTPAAPEARPIDVKQARKLARGRTAIDGRIDLHGLRRDEAKRALRSFLLSSQAQGRRTVLVITGKGKQADPARQPWYDQSQRGVLRQEVPGWLTSPEFAAIVVGFSEASQRHGGSGALYVQIRRAGRFR